jgi:predicted secreted protein
MRLTWGVALFAVLCLGVACSSDEEAGPSPTSTISETPATEPTAAPATTPATTSTTTAPTTTAAPTTTIDPTDALIAEIEADLNEGEQVFLEAASAPDDPQLRAAVLRYFSGESLGSVTRILDQLVAEGLLGRPSDSIDNVIAVRTLEELNEADATAIVVVCRVDAAIVYEAFSDGSEAIVSDTVTAVVSR